MSKRSFLFQVLGSLTLGFFLFYFSTSVKTIYSKPGEINQIDFSSQQEKKVISYSGPVDDCLQFYKIYNKTPGITAECTANYAHFYPNESRAKEKNLLRSTTQLRIGSFNLFHLGDNQAPLKNFALMATYIDQWDLVGVQELMPLALGIAADNQLIADLISKQTDIEFPFENWSVINPGYLSILNQLQKLDSSWSLILQATAEGGEMAGFYYRASTVKPKEWDYCPLENAVDLEIKTTTKNFACLTQIPKETKILTSRVAFAAYFQSGNFDFIALTAHNRFRASLVPKEVIEQKKEICKNHSHPDKCKIAEEHIGRYFEILAVIQQVPLMKEKAHDADVIFMGDFNLDLKASSQEIWKSALRPAEGLKPYQKDPTTVGVKFSKMINSYDHFILDPKYTTECITETVKSFNFVNPAQVKIYKKNMKEVIREKKQAAETLVKVQKAANDLLIRVLNEKEKTEAIGNIDDALKRMKINDHAFMLELVSDHIPIEMTCNKNLPDDD